MTVASGAELLAGLYVAAAYAMLTPAMYYLGSRAAITRFAWSRYPAWLDYYTFCAACSGFLYGVICALGIGWYLDVPFLFLPGRYWLTPVIAGVLSIFWTPVMAARHLTALETTSPPAPTPGEAQPPKPASAGKAPMPPPLPEP